ncbi:hypothetical protein WN943_018935 [Citrus x changshan-huyou]
MDLELEIMSLPVNLVRRSLTIRDEYIDSPFCGNDSDNSVYSLSASDDNDVYNQPTELGQNANEPKVFQSDDDDADELLSCYSSDDNEFDTCFGEDGDRVIDQMVYEISANIYIPVDDLLVEFFMGQYLKNYRAVVKILLLNKDVRDRNNTLMMCLLGIGWNRNRLEWE